jgi:hypothetical protein
MLHLDPQGQTQRIQRSSALENELVRVKVRPRVKPKRGGGAQPMYALTLRGFSPWILSIHPDEVEGNNLEETEHIRTLIRAYQEEAKDVLYEYFINRSVPGGQESRETSMMVVPEVLDELEPGKPTELAEGASEEEELEYYEKLEWWAHWKKMLLQQRWRRGIEIWRGEIEAQQEGAKEMLALLPEVLARLGPEKITLAHQRQVQAYVRQLHEVSGKAYPTIHDDLKTVFQKPRYQDLLEEEWPEVERWFQLQIAQAKKSK